MAKIQPVVPSPVWRDQSVSLTGFCLSDGLPLTDATVQVRRFGPDDAPVVVVLGGVSSDRRVADIGDGRAAWWPRIVRPGGAVDLDRFQVLGLDLLPSLGETDIRTLTPADQARALGLILDQLDIARIEALIGASYGGMVGLAFATLFPDRLKQLIAISSPHQPAVWATAQRGIQRRILSLGLETGRTDEAIALARELAMTTYRSPGELTLRFGEESPPGAAGQPYAVCDYLKARGQAYVTQTTAQRWISLSDALDRHRVGPETVTVPTTVLGFTSDALVPLADLEALAARLPRLKRFAIAPSLYGHDGFLKEDTIVAGLITEALAHSRPETCPLPEIAA